MPDLLLCTDLDRTLLPNGAEPESPDARGCFKRLVSRPGVVLVYVTGRDRHLVDRAIREFSLPEPDFVISDVGTNIFDLRSGRWQLWPAWHREIAPDWREYDGHSLADMLHDIGQLRLQEQAKQNTYKLSFYAPLDADLEWLSDEIALRLGSRGIRANIVWSIDEPAGTGLLDILPQSASKLHAIEFLRQSLSVSRQHTLFAGDSGNDLAVFASPIPSVVVANATAVVREDALREADRLGNADSLYFAEGGHLGMNGNYSAGILEGVAHFFPRLASRLQRGARQ